MEKYFLFPTCVVEKELLYSITHNNCIIDKIDLKNNKVICIDNPDGYNSKEWSGADNILLYNQKIYFFEQNGKRIMEYSVTDKKTRYFDLNLQAYLYFNYAYCTIWDNRIYIFPSFINESISVFNFSLVTYFFITLSGTKLKTIFSFNNVQGISL